MTEQEWLASNDPQAMLECLASKPKSHRKQRLLAVAFCRSVWHLLAHERSRTAIEVAEDYADDLATPEELQTAFLHAEDDGDIVVGAAESADASEECLNALRAVGLAAKAAFETSNPFVDSTLVALDPASVARAVVDALRAAAEVPSDDVSVLLSAPDAMEFVADLIAPYADVQFHVGRDGDAEEGVQCSLLRCIFGNPFRSVPVNSSWLTGKFIGIAQAIYDERAFDRLPILADTLEETGCTDADLLAHCRGPGPHVRGCWVVDLLLGKE